MGIAQPVHHVGKIVLEKFLFHSEIFGLEDAFTFSVWKYLGHSLGYLYL
jgi:hypothetical protein